MLKFLKSDAEFKAFRKSQLFQSKTLKIRVHYSLNQNSPRFGFIVPKKVIPKVVDRNLLKRRIKSVLSAQAGKLKNADVIFYPPKDLLKKNFKTISSEINELFTKAKLWK